MLPHTIILAIVSSLAITSSVHGVNLPATQDQVSNKRDMSSVWLAQAEAQAMVPLKRRNNVLQPAGIAMKSHNDCDDDEDEDDDEDDDEDEWDEDDNHGNGHHGKNDHHAEMGHGTNGRQGTMDGTHDESGTFIGTYTVTMVPGATATNAAGQPEMTGRPSAASVVVVKTRSGAGLALVSLVLAIYFL